MCIKVPIRPLIPQYSSKKIACFTKYVICGHYGNREKQRVQNAPLWPAGKRESGTTTKAVVSGGSTGRAAATEAAKREVGAAPAEVAAAVVLDGGGSGEKAQQIILHSLI